MSLCTTAYALHTRFANIFSASLSEATVRPNPRRVLVTLRALLDALCPEPCLAVLQALLRDEPRTQPPLGVGEAVTVVQELTRVVARGAAGDAPSPFWAPAVGELLELCLAGAVSVGLGRIVALYYCPSTLYQNS